MFRPITCHEGPEGEKRCRSTLSLTSALDGGVWLTPRPGRLTTGKETRYPFIGGWVGPRAALDGCGKSRPHRDSIPGLSIQLAQSVQGLAVDWRVRGLPIPVAARSKP